MKDFKFQISDFRLPGESSSPLLGAKKRRRSRTFFGIGRGAADPPICIPPYNIL
jgi:hypothetical protein